MKRATLYSGAAKWSNGLNLHGTTLNLVHFTSGVISSALNNARTTEQVYQTTRDGKKDAADALKSARAAARLFAEKARDVLKPFLGNTYSASWPQAGFKNNSLAIPQSTAALLDLLGSVRLYLTNNPTHQNATAGVTSAAATTALANLEVAATTLSNCRRDQRTKRDLRNSAEKTLVSNLRASRNEVEAVLPLQDPRWLDFLEVVPADLRAPDPVTDLVVEPGMAGHLLASWQSSARAEWYAVETLVVGADTEFQPAVTVHDPAADLTFTPGARVQVRVTARNAAGDSAPSTAVEALVPLSAAA